MAFMKEILGLYFIKNNKLISNDFFESSENSEGTIIYEVIRVIDGKILFFNDHIERFMKSLSGCGCTCNIDKKQIKEQISLLLQVNQIYTGNIKFLFNLSKGGDFYAFFIPYYYPSDDEYLRGINLSSIVAERPNPNIKRQHDKLNLQILKLKEETNAYEVLLINHNCFITEGSKSNFFLIKGNEIFTAPEKDILSGITRKYIFQLCMNFNLPVYEINIKVSDLNNFDAAFISGTSPKILPVKRINDVLFDANNLLLRKLMQEFEKVIIENLEFIDKL